MLTGQQVVSSEVYTGIKDLLLALGQAGLTAVLTYRNDHGVTLVVTNAGDGMAGAALSGKG